MSVAGDATGANAPSFGTAVLSIVRKVFGGGGGIRRRSSSTCESAVSASVTPTLPTGRDVEGGSDNKGNDLNGNESSTSLNKCFAVVGDSTHLAVCPRCGCQLTTIERSVPMMTIDVLPFHDSAIASCTRCGWTVTAFDHHDDFIAAPPDVVSSKKYRYGADSGEPVCVCSQCSRARLLAGGAVACCDSGGDSASSTSSSSSLVLLDSLSSSDVSSTAAAASCPFGLPWKPPGKPHHTRHMVTPSVCNVLRFYK